MSTLFTNNRVTLTNDLVFGVCVLTTTGFVPIKDLTPEGLELVRELLDFNRTCPAAIFDAVYGLEVLETVKENSDVHAH